MGGVVVYLTTLWVLHQYVLKLNQLRFSNTSGFKLEYHDSLTFPFVMTSEKNARSFNELLRKAFATSDQLPRKVVLCKAHQSQFNAPHFT